MSKRCLVLCKSLIANISKAAAGAAGSLLMRTGHIFFVLIAFHINKKIDQGFFQLAGVVYGKITVFVMNDPIRRTCIISFLHQQAICRELINM